METLTVEEPATETAPVESPQAPAEEGAGDTIGDERAAACGRVVGPAACMLCDKNCALAGLFVGPENVQQITGEKTTEASETGGTDNDTAAEGSATNIIDERPFSVQLADDSKTTIVARRKSESPTQTTQPQEQPKNKVSAQAPTARIEPESTSSQSVQKESQRANKTRETTPPKPAPAETTQTNPQPESKSTTAETMPPTSEPEESLQPQQPKPPTPKPTEKANATQAATETRKQPAVEKPIAIDTGESPTVPKAENHDATPKQAHILHKSISAPEQKTPDSKPDTQPQTAHADVGGEPTVVLPDESASLHEQGEPNVTVANVRRSETAAPTEPHIETTHLDSDATPQPPTPETAQVDESIDGFVAPADVIDVETHSVDDEAMTVLLGEPIINDAIPSPEKDEQTPPVIIEDATPEITEEPLIIDDTDDNEAALTAVGEALEAVDLPPEIAEEIDVAPLTHEEENDEQPVKDQVAATIDNGAILNDATEITAAPEPIQEQPSAEITASEASDNNEFEPLVASTDDTEATSELQLTIDTDEDPPCPYRLVDEEPDEEEDDEINPNQTPLEILISNEAVLEPDEEIVVDDSFDITAQQPKRSAGIRSIRHIARRLIGQIAYILAA